jgi:uncharacterized membrane protein YphA (DoxX/SURF4 family)
MFQSFKYSNLILRLSLAIVFFWFGIDKFFHPDYWLNAWVPQSVVSFAGNLKLHSVDVVYITGVFEILVATSLATNIFVAVFSLLAVLFLTVIMFFHGFSEVMMRDVGLMGAFLSLIFWPRQRYYQ